MSVNMNITIPKKNGAPSFKHGYVYMSNVGNVYLALTQLPYDLNMPKGSVLLMCLSNREYNLYFEDADRIKEIMGSYVEIGQLNVAINEG